jgi:hypothetical protein
VTTSTPTPTPSHEAVASTIARSFAAAVADRTLDRLGAHLGDDVVLRALVPGGFVEEDGRDAVLARYDLWFGHWDTVDLLEVAGDAVGGSLLVHYKLRFDPDGDRRVLTQTLVCRLSEGLLRRIDLVCTGFRSY